MHNIMLWGGGATLLSLANRSKERRSSIVEYILASLVFDACLVLCWKCRRTDGRKSRMRMLPRREHRVLRQTSWIENVNKTFYPIRLFFPQDEEQRRCTVCGRTLFMNCQSAAQLYYLSHHKNEWMNQWMNEWINEWMNQWMNQWMNESMNKWINEWMNELRLC